MTARRFDLTVVIATYKRAALLDATLHSLNAVRASGRVWEAIVVDNNSGDDTKAIVARHARDFAVPLRYLVETRQGRSSALNAGIAAASGAVIVMTDDDVQVDEGWLTAAGDALLGDAERSIRYAGGPVEPIWEAPPPRWLDLTRGDLWGTIAIQDHGADTFVYEVARKVPLGANVAAHRSLFDEVGGFRAEMGLCHDLELTMRVAAYGDVVYVDEPLLDYTVREDSITATLVRQHVRQGSAMVEVGAAWLSILSTHQARRQVSTAERQAIHAAIARAFLQRALLHATAAEGHGRRAALLDVVRAGWYSPRTTVLTWRVAVAMAAMLAPRFVIDQATVLGHRLGLVVI